jgi:hypothetical protein
MFLRDTETVSRPVPVPLDTTATFFIFIAGASIILMFFLLLDGEPVKKNGPSLHRDEAKLRGTHLISCGKIRMLSAAP